MTAIRHLRRILGRSSSRVNYVFAIPAGEHVGIWWSDDVMRDVKTIRREVPSAKAGYLHALPEDIDARRVGKLAHFKLKDKAAGGGWFRCDLESAIAAIEEASTACGAPTAFHTTSEALTANRSAF